MTAESKPKFPEPARVGLRQQLLLAAVDCSVGDMEKTFTAEELLLAAWKRDRAAWGLRGHENDHPDSEKIYKELDRVSVRGFGEPWIAGEGTPAHFPSYAGGFGGCKRSRWHESGSKGDGRKTFSRRGGSNSISPRNWRVDRRFIHAEVFAGCSLSDHAPIEVVFAPEQGLQLQGFDIDFNLFKKA